MMDPFLYNDYRQFVRDWIEWAKGRRGFSQRRFSLRAGFRSPGYLKMVVTGRRNLGEEGLERFMNGLRLVKEERLYFRNLVLWNQAETDAEKSLYEGKLNLLRKCRKEKPALLAEVREKIERFRDEIVENLASDFSPEESALLVSQFLPEK